MGKFAVSRVAALVLAILANGYSASADEIVLPASKWSDYQIIMWQPYPASAYPLLKDIGITAGMVHADRNAPGRPVASEIEPLLRNDLPWYVENIATDFYSEYHRWFPNHPVNWHFTDAQKRYQENPLDPAVLQRSPSLSDPDWLRRIRERLGAVVEAHRRFRPLYYNLADEPGIADLSMFWDFDFSEPSLRAMRQWLQQRYATLEALNRQWGSSFARWDDVMPLTTPQAMQRSDGNLSAWADFKEWMDVAFARALRAGTDAVHEADPDAVAALEGGQVPGWGGWDYARLATAVDLMEIWDDNGSLEIARSINPSLVLLTTSFGQGPAEEHHVWRELLRGTRGLILWDENNGFVGKDGTIGTRGRLARPYYQEIRGGLGAQLINSRRQADPIVILDSPASMRVRWFLDWQRKGNGWSRLDPDATAADNAPRQASMRGFLRGIELSGLEPRFVSSRLLEDGALDRGDVRILVLPYAIALSSGEAAAIRRFVERGGNVIADGEPGLYDEHGRRLERPALSDIFPAGPSAAPSAGFEFGTGKAVYWAPPKSLSEAAAPPPDANAVGALRELLRSRGVAPRFAVTGADGQAADDVARYIFASGDVTIIGLQRDHASAPGDGTVTLGLPEPSFVYDMRSRRALGRLDHVTLALDPIAPTVLAVAHRPLPAPTIAGPTSLRLGDTGEFRLGVAGGPDPALHVLHVDVVDPAGNVVGHYSGNVVARGGEASRVLPLAVNDAIGGWRIRVTDLLSGQSTTAALAVEP